MILSVFTNDIITNDLIKGSEYFYIAKDRMPMVLMLKEKVNEILKSIEFLMGLVTKRVLCEDFNIDVKILLKACDKYICNPNNPTGICINNSKINYLIKN